MGDSVRVEALTVEIEAELPMGELKLGIKTYVGTFILRNLCLIFPFLVNNAVSIFKKKITRIIVRGRS